jgi:hypothetical protein
LEYIEWDRDVGAGKYIIRVSSMNGISTRKKIQEKKVIRLKRFFLRVRRVINRHRGEEAQYCVCKTEKISRCRRKVNTMQMPRATRPRWSHLTGRGSFPLRWKCKHSNYSRISCLWDSKCLTVISIGFK